MSKASLPRPTICGHCGRWTLAVPDFAPLPRYETVATDAGGTCMVRPAERTCGPQTLRSGKEGCGSAAEVSGDDERFVIREAPDDGVVVVLVIRQPPVVCTRAEGGSS